MIFCIGHFRTGTTSYHEAVQRLGFIDAHLPLAPLLRLNAGGGVTPDMPWDSVSNLHERPEEWDACERLYPGARYVVTTRPVDDWTRSMRAFLQRRLSAPIRERLRSVFGTDLYEEDTLRRAFVDQPKLAMARFGARALILDLCDADKMGKLAAFLRDVPRPYPHVNATRRRHADPRMNAHPGPFRS